LESMRSSSPGPLPCHGIHITPPPLGCAQVCLTNKCFCECPLARHL
jgi:hypothetical protein